MCSLLHHALDLQICQSQGKADQNRQIFLCPLAGSRKWHTHARSSWAGVTSHRRIHRVRGTQAGAAVSRQSLDKSRPADAQTPHSSTAPHPYAIRLSSVVLPRRVTTHLAAQVHLCTYASSHYHSCELDRLVCVQPGRSDEAEVLWLPRRHRSKGHPGAGRGGWSGEGRGQGARAER